MAFVVGRDRDKVVVELNKSGETLENLESCWMNWWDFDFDEGWFDSDWKRTKGNRRVLF